MREPLHGRPEGENQAQEEQGLVQLEASVQCECRRGCRREKDLSGSLSEAMMGLIHSLAGDLWPWFIKTMDLMMFQRVKAGIIDSHSHVS